MKTYRATFHQKTWARLPKKLPGDWWKKLYAPLIPKPFPSWIRTVRFDLTEFKLKLDKVLKPLGFAAVSCEYDMRYYRVSIHMKHTFPVRREFVHEPRELDYRIEQRDTPVTLADMLKIVVTEPESWQCRFDIAEEEFMNENHKYLLQRCCHFATDAFTQFQLSKVGA